VTLASGESTELTLVADTSGLPSGLYGVDPYVGTSFELVDVDVKGDA
jgi:hypothetical protein